MGSCRGQGKELGSQVSLLVLASPWSHREQCHLETRQEGDSLDPHSSHALAVDDVTLKVKLFEREQSPGQTRCAKDQIISVLCFADCVVSVETSLLLLNCTLSHAKMEWLHPSSAVFITGCSATCNSRQYSQHSGG